MDEQTATDPKRIRIVHLVDLHVQPERDAPKHLARALSKVSALLPDAVLLGGDVVMNTVGVNLERAMVQWNLWHEAKTHLRAPIHPCIGNQDCWGWNKKASGCTGDEPLFGKALALRELGLVSPYYALDLGVWHVIVLDSVQQGGRHGYIAELDGVQRGWLTAELESNKTRPTIILSHVPIVAGPADLFSSHITEPDSAGMWPLPSQHLHRDSFELVELLRRNTQVKICLAGHIHVAQKMELAGISFIGSPAVCGEWWRGDFLGYPSGFTVIDLYSDGRFATAFSHY